MSGSGIGDPGPEPSADGAVPTGPVDPPGRVGANPPDGRGTRNRTARFAWGAVVVILVAVIALVTYALTDPTPQQQAAQRTTTAPEVVGQLAKVPPSVFDTVGITTPGTTLTAPVVLSGQPSLRYTGKPEVLYVGAEYCPFCAAERWPLIVALSRFGRFTGLKNMQSASLSVFSDIQTFSFVGSTYSSRYLTFTGVELYSDEVDAQGTFTRIATLTPAQAAVVTHYDERPGTSASSGTFPFVDIDNRMVTSTSGFSPALLVKQSQEAVAGGLTQAANPVTQAVVAAANQLTAGVCAATGQQPEPVCSSKGVQEAAASLGMT
jgi:hypothetical protein